MADTEYVFVASGEACATCLALDGTDASPPHENCLCQVVPRDSDCEIEYHFSGHYYGPGAYDGGAGGEITVTCPDGSTISESFDVDFAPYAASGDDTLDIATEAAEEEAASLCAECPEPEPFNCC